VTIVSRRTLHDNARRQYNVNITGLPDAENGCDDGSNLIWHLGVYISPDLSAAERKNERQHWQAVTPRNAEFSTVSPTRPTSISCCFELLEYFCMLQWLPSQWSHASFAKKYWLLNCFLNARSVLNKLYALHNMLYAENSDLILITDSFCTWLC